MLINDFNFDLPENLIANQPLKNRSSSRLLVAGLDDKEFMVHDKFKNITRWLKPGDLLVLNNTKVIPARLYGVKSSGGKVEVLIERVVDNKTALAHVKASRSPKVGSGLFLENNIEVMVKSRVDNLFELTFESTKSIIDLLNKYGHMPLPPYIKREEVEEDKTRYQTVYAQKEGAVAAPTAGLHFDKDLLDTIQNLGVKIAYVTLHVGAGTFQPVKVKCIEDHKMHSEYIEVSDKVCEAVQKTKSSGGRVIAVGTTSVRCLETATTMDGIKPYYGETSIFIYPGCIFKCVDLLITNFHLPKSTLLMLVAAFSGRDEIFSIYNEAIKQKYRFFSYGDAMLLRAKK